MAEDKAGKGARTRGLVPAALATLVAFSIMVALGNWQLERLHWKEGLVAAIESGLKKEPAPLEEPADAWKELRREEYRPVTVRGRFLHEYERHLFATDNGQMGWHIYTPLETEGGRILFVNRGFVPDALKEPSTRPDGQIAGTVTVNGLVRAPGVQGSFEPDRDPTKNVWHWRDLAGMIASMGIEGAWTRMIPFFVDATVEPVPPGGWPKGGATRLDLPNRHLEYALTWFGLAGTLLVVFGAFVWTRLRGRAEDGRVLDPGRGDL